MLINEGVRHDFEWNALKGLLFKQTKSVKKKNVFKDVLEGLHMLLKAALDSMKTIFGLVKLTLTIRFSTAGDERGFSLLNRIKTSQWSIMSQEC